MHNFITFTNVSFRNCNVLNIEFTTTILSWCYKLRLLSFLERIYVYIILYININIYIYICYHESNVPSWLSPLMYIYIYMVENLSNLSKQNNNARVLRNCRNEMIRKQQRKPNSEIMFKVTRKRDALGPREPTFHQRNSTILLEMQTEQEICNFFHSWNSKGQKFRFLTRKSKLLITCVFWFNVIWI